MYRGWLTNVRIKVKTARRDGRVFGGVFSEENDAREVVCVSPLHLLAADTMMRQIVRVRS